MSNTYFNISDKLRLYEFDGLLDQYGDAAAAYSLRKLRSGYTGSAIRVRRSSDNTERDMGFYDNELDTIALLDWVNEEILHFDADLNDPTGWTLQTGVTMAGGAINFDNANSSTAAFKKYGAIPYEKVRVTFTIENYVSGAVNWANYGGGAQDADFKTADGTYIVERVLGGGNSNWGFSAQSFTGSVTQFKVEIIASNGFVHTWYDQSANANHAVQGTATAQPKIVDAGTLFTENGKAAILDLNENKSLTAGLINFASGNWNITQVVTTKGTDINTSIGADGVDDLYFEPNRIGFGLRMFWRNNLTLEESPETDRTNQQFIGFYNNNNNLLEQHINSTLINSGVATDGPRSTSQIFLFSWNTEQSGNVALQEAIFWQLDQSTKRADIESNINTYYDIY